MALSTKRTILSPPDKEWQSDEVTLTVLTTRSRARAFLQLYFHAPQSYNSMGRDSSKFVSDVQDALALMDGPEPKPDRSEAEQKALDPERPTRRGGPCDPVMGGRALEHVLTGIDPFVPPASAKW